MTSKLLKRIMELAVEINGSGPNSQKDESKTPTVFLNMYGHTGILRLEIVEESWKPNLSVGMGYRANIGSVRELQSLVDVLEAVKQKYEKEIEERDGDVRLR